MTTTAAWEHFRSCRHYHQSDTGAYSCRNKSFMLREQQRGNKSYCGFRNGSVQLCMVRSWRVHCRNGGYFRTQAGYYAVTVTDSKGCTASANITLTQPAVLTSVEIGRYCAAMQRSNQRRRQLHRCRGHSALCLYRSIEHFGCNTYQCPGFGCSNQCCSRNHNGQGD